jgi:hypothetical protein
VARAIQTVITPLFILSGNLGMRFAHYYVSATKIHGKPHDELSEKQVAAVIRRNLAT